MEKDILQMMGINYFVLNVPKRAVYKFGFKAMLSDRFPLISQVTEYQIYYTEDSAKKIKIKKELAYGSRLWFKCINFINAFSFSYL